MGVTGFFMALISSSNLAADPDVLALLIGPSLQLPLEVPASALLIAMTPAEGFLPIPEWTFQALPTMPAVNAPAPAAAAIHLQHSAAPHEKPVALSAPPVAAAGMDLTQAQVDAFASGLAGSLGSIASNVVSQIFADSLPIVGDNLGDAAGAGAPALQFVSALRGAIGTGFATLSGSPTYTEAQLETALNSALSAAGIPGSVNLVLTNATDITLSFATTKSFAALSVPLDASIGFSGLGLTTSGAAQTALGYTLNFTSGLDPTGFYVDTRGGASTFRIGADTKIPGFSADAELSLLHFHATDDAATPTRFNATFEVTLKDTNNDGHLRAGEFGGDVLDAVLNGAAVINLKLASDLGTAVLPDIAADLNINWGFGNAVVDPAAGNANFGNAPSVAFTHVSLGLGPFFSDFVSPIFDTVQIFTAPLQPIVDVLKTRIGFLSDLTGSDVTLLDVAGGISALSPETKDRLELYTDLIDFINSVPTNSGAVRIDLGDFSLGQADPRAAIFQLANAVPQSIRNVIAPGSQNGDLGSFFAGKNALPGGGLSFPIIENPTSAINLLFGKPVDFFTYHVPGLDIDGLGFDQFYRIFGPFGVRLTATVEAHAFLDIGYDSSGLTQFAASGDAEDIFNGFFVVDQPGAEGTLQAKLEAFAAFNVIFAEAGVGGGIVGNLNAYLNDTDFHPGDGRIHIGELSNSCVFTLSGEVTAGLSAYLTVGFGPFSETFEKNFGTEVLVSFDVSGCDAAGTPGVPVLAHTTGSTVALHVGADASLRQVGSLEDSSEDFGVTHGSGSLGG